MAVLVSPNVGSSASCPGDAGIQAIRTLLFRALDWGEFYAPADARPL